ncbi:unnamed protein product, partial [marine sediment metagenome]
MMNDNPQHTFQILTKRADVLYEYNQYLNWSENIWMGTTVEDQENVKRIDYLSGTGAYIKFLSLEPLIGKISDLNLKNIDWVIVGGESGPGARPMKEEWVISIKD